jgi:hypothetical protein
MANQLSSAAKKKSQMLAIKTKETTFTLFGHYHLFLFEVRVSFVSREINPCKSIACQYVIDAASQMQCMLTCF